MSRSPSDEKRADHRHDLRKHDWRPALVSIPETGPRDDIGPHIFTAEQTADALGEVNPLRLAGDVGRIEDVAERLLKIASAARRAHRRLSDAS